MKEEAYTNLLKAVEAAIARFYTLAYNRQHEGISPFTGANELREARDAVGYSPTHKYITLLREVDFAIQDFEALIVDRSDERVNPEYRALCLQKILDAMREDEEFEKQQQGALSEPLKAVVHLPEFTSSHSVPYTLPDYVMKDIRDYGLECVVFGIEFARGKRA